MMTETIKPRAVTAGELRDEFTGTCRILADNWIAEKITRPGLPREAAEAVEGLLHSLLSVFDGDVAGLPAFEITARPGPYDKETRQIEGECWIEPGTVINDGVQLHELLYRGDWRGRHPRPGDSS